MIKGGDWFFCGRLEIRFSFAKKADEPFLCCDPPCRQVSFCSRERIFKKSVNPNKLKKGAPHCAVISGENIH